MLTDFHILRPEALWLLPLCLLLWGALRKKARQSNSWSQVLPAEFLKVLAPGTIIDSKSVQSWGWPVILMLGILALSGPALNKVETPAGLKEDPVIVVFDLSLSMLATDQSPNRLKRAQQKLYDLIELRNEGQTGLVVFAGSGHVVTPLTEDITTLKAMIPALDPFIMPDLGSNAASGIETAITALQQAGNPQGRILLLTDGIEKDDLAKITDLVKDANVSLSVIGIGTADGGPIPIPNRGFIKQNDTIVVAKPNFDAMQQLATSSGGHFSQIALDSRDIRYVLPELMLNRGESSETQTSLNWQDAGYWLLFPIVILVLCQYRRASALLCLLIFCFNPENSYAFGWDDLWKTPNQQAQQAYDQQQFNKAAQLFQDPMHKGMAFYRSGDYASAVQAFAKTDTAQGHFNLGNALVEQQQFEQALKAYEQALKLNPEFSAAKTNKQKLEEFLKQQSQQKSDNSSDKSEQSKEQSQKNQQNQPGQSQQDQNNSQDGQGQQSQANQDQQNQNQQNKQGQSSNSQDEQNQVGQQNKDLQSPQDDPENANAGQLTEPNQKAPEEQAASKQQNDLQDQENSNGKDGNAQVAGMADANIDLKDQQTEQWLRRIPDDPGGLLRRKFLQQYQSNNRNRSGDGGGRTIW